MDAKIIQANIQTPNTIQEYPFGFTSGYLFIENQSTNLAKIYFKESAFVYSAVPITLDPGEKLPVLPLETDALKVESGAKGCKVEIVVLPPITGGGGGGPSPNQASFEKIEINDSTIFPANLKVFASGQTLRRTIVKLIDAFDLGFDAKIGFPADDDEIYKFGEIDYEDHEFVGVLDPYRQFAVSETLQVSSNGTPLTQGRAFIFLEY